MDCATEVANVVYAETRGEQQTGMAAVLHVILNRAKEQGVRPCIIIKQKNQFARGLHKPNDPTWKLAKKLVLSPGKDPTRGATYFHNLTVRPSWSYKFRISFRFGEHIFYKK